MASLGLTRRLKLVITTGSTQNTDGIIYATKNKIKQIWDNKYIINWHTSSKHVIKNVILSLKRSGYEILISPGHLEARRVIEPISWTTTAISAVLGIIFVNNHLTMQLLAAHDKIYSYTLKTRSVHSVSVRKRIGISKLNFFRQLATRTKYGMNRPVKNRCG